MKKINNNNPQIGIFGSLKKVVTGTGLSRVFGLFRDISTTNLMGASVFHDIFVICFKIPNTFRHFFAEGAFNQAFIPVYSDYHKNNDEKSAKEFLNAVAGTLLVILFTFSILVLLFAPIFLFMFAPGFYFDPQKKFLSVEILSIMFPYLALISLVAFAGGIQNTHNKFSIPAFTPVIFNICLIVAAVIIAPSFEMPIYVLAWGVLLSGVLQLLIQIAPLLIINRLPIPKLNFKNQGVKNFLKLILPAVLAGGIFHINLLVDTIFASLLETGSPTWLYVSDRLIQFPMGIFAIAFGTVLLPTLSKYNLEFERDKFVDNIRKGQRFVLYIGIPSLLGLYLSAEHLISTIFFRGAFMESDVINASNSLMAFSLGLPFFMLMKVLTPAFFSRKDTKTPMYVALISLISNSILNYLLAFYFGLGHIGIALGSSISAVISVLILEVILLRDGFIKISNIFNRFNLTVLIASIALIAFLNFYTNKYNFLYLNQLERIYYLSIEVLFAALIYFTISRLIFRQPLKTLLD